MSSRITLPIWAGLSARAAVALLTLIYGLAGGGIAVFATWSDYRETVSTVERNTADLSRLLEDHFTHALQVSDLLLTLVAERARSAGPAGLAVDGSAWTDMAAAATRFGHLGSLFVLDAEGRMIAHSAPREAFRFDVSGSDYLAAIRGGADAFIGQVTRDPASGAYVFPVARRLTGPEGAFIGLAVATVRVSYFKSLYSGLNLGGNPALGVYRLDGAILVREPLPEADIGRNMSKNPVFTQYLPQAPIGTYHGRSAYDGVERIVSYRKLENPPLLVWVAMSLTEALKPWERRLYRNAGLAVFGLMVATALTLLAFRAVGREAHVKSDLLRANQSLQRANTDLERFAEVAAHHLQEPLRSIASFAQLLERRLADQLDGEAKVFLGYLITGSNNMKQLLHDLHRYTALQRGELPEVQVTLGEVAARAVAQLQPKIRATQARIEIGELPTVRGDAAQLQMLFRQLLENALTYRSPDRLPHIVVSAERDRGSWAISVRDNGIGIDPRFRERIFRIFERLHPREQYPGTGIGLAICRKIVERHGGHITCGADQPEGSTFLFTVAA